MTTDVLKVEAIRSFPINFSFALDEGGVLGTISPVRRRILARVERAFATMERKTFNRRNYDELRRRVWRALKVYRRHGFIADFWWASFDEVASVR